MIGKIGRKALDVVKAPKPVRQGTGELRNGAFDNTIPGPDDGANLAEELGRDGI